MYCSAVAVAKSEEICQNVSNALNKLMEEPCFIIQKVYMQMQKPKPPS
jgi:hypothetical protein